MSSHERQDEIDERGIRTITDRARGLILMIGPVSTNSQTMMVALILQCPFTNCQKIHRPATLRLGVN